MKLDSHSPSYRRLLGVAFSVALAAVLVPCPPAAGKPVTVNTALIFGTVWDPDGRPVYGVKVKIRRADKKKAQFELYSDHQGEFAQRVPAGTADYIVWTDLKDYKLPNGRHLRAGPEVTVHVQNDERADMGLHLIW